MENPNPATPAQAAAPGTREQVSATPSAATPPAAPGTGGQPEGIVTISAKEHAQFLRDSARVRSFESRAKFQKSRNNSQPANVDPDDPANAEITRLQSERDDANKRATQAEIRGRVRDLLDKEEFKSLPKSTRELILKSPHMLSEADNAEEALLDIEDFVREQVVGLETASAQLDPKTTPASPGNPKGHETPPVVSTGVPSQTPAAGMEETSNLRGSALSRAVLRNALRKKQQGSKV